MQAITDDSFEKDVLQASTPVLVDFWAPWCGPCKAMAPTLEEVAKDYEGKVQFVKMDVDENPATAPKFGIRGVPTLILFIEGQAKATQVGLLNKAELAQFIDNNI